MNIKTKSIQLKGSSDVAGAIINSLCNFGTDEYPRVPTTDEKWEAIRTVRNELIEQTDWTQLMDSPLSEEQKLSYILYRDKLRDIPQDFENPEDVVFPEEK